MMKEDNSAENVKHWYIVAPYRFGGQRECAITPMHSRKGGGGGGVHPQGGPYILKQKGKCICKRDTTV